MISSAGVLSAMHKKVKELTSERQSRFNGMVRVASYYLVEKVYDSQDYFPWLVNMIRNEM